MILGGIARLPATNLVPIRAKHLMREGFFVNSDRKSQIVVSLNINRGLFSDEADIAASSNEPVLERLSEEFGDQRAKYRHDQAPDRDRKIRSIWTDQSLGGLNEPP